MIEPPDGPPDWETLLLPPDHILSHLTDAHCHPTDLTHDPAVYDGVKLGGIAAMATEPENQEKVSSLAHARPWRTDVDMELPRKGEGVRAIACFGYHPWFSHRYSMTNPAPTRKEHYESIFFPPSDSSQLESSRRASERALLERLLLFFPDPISFEPLLQQLRHDIQESLERKHLTMLGEVGLDGAARARWPVSARHLYQEKHIKGEDEAEPEEGGWKRITPFKVVMSHQLAIVRAQIEIAIECGVNVSFHSVSAAGPTMDILKEMRDTHGVRFTNRVNVDLHSAGGWSPPFWIQAEKQFLNLYASPSIFITGRSSSAPDLIRAVSKDRMLVESDSHDVRLSTQLVWAAAEWISRCKGWKLEGDSIESWTLTTEEDVDAEFDSNGRPWADRKNRTDRQEETIWTIKTLERNWARFMGLVDAAD